MKNTKKLYESIMASVAKQVKKTLNESAGDGWNLSELYELDEAINEIESFIYEVRNCVRGAYTNCYTYADLADELRSIANSLSAVADEIENIPEPDPEDEDDEEYKDI